MELFKQVDTTALPVVNYNKEVIGVINQKDITHLIALQSLTGWSSLKNYSVESLFLNPTNKVSWDAGIEEISIEFADKNVEIIPVIEKNEEYSGYCITARKLISYTSNTIKPRTLGGLATPLGVYLTDGIYQTGAGNAGLILTGILFAILINVISLISAFLLRNFEISETFVLVLQLSLFLLILRLTPLTGYHAAEHQTIHAIEKGIDLTIENIKKQPKEHERCGTNIMVLVLGLSIIAMVTMDYLYQFSFSVQLLFVVFFTLLLLSNWRKMGMKLQEFFTTRNPSEKQLKSGMKAGVELLNIYNNNTRPLQPTVLLKIWNMGLIQVLISFMTISILLQTLLTYLWPTLFVYVTIMLYW
jgi:hypothetical protein